MTFGMCSGGSVHVLSSRLEMPFATAAKWSLNHLQYLNYKRERYLQRSVFVKEIVMAVDTLLILTYLFASYQRCTNGYGRASAVWNSII